MGVQVFKQPEGKQQEIRENIFAPPEVQKTQKSETEVRSYKQGDPRIVGLSLALQSLIDKEKIPQLAHIPWGEVQEIRVSRNDSAYSATFNTNNAQIVTAKTGPGFTDIALTKPDGTLLVQATQKGNEITIVDFSAADKLSKMGKIRLA